MPRISEELLDCSIYLYPSREYAMAGSEIGGSGFIATVPAGEKAPGQSITFAVTNKHVIETGNPVVRVNYRDNSIGAYTATEREWFLAPEQDLAVLLLPTNHEVQRFRGVGLDGFITREKAKTLDVGPGTDTFLVGRFIHRDGGQTNIPTARFGHVAQMPTMIKNSLGKEIESYLVETRSIGGYSGSPVFAYKLPFDPKIGDKGMENVDGAHWGPALLGVDWGHTLQTEPVMDASDRETQMYVASNTALTTVVPAWRLADLLLSEPVQTFAHAKLDDQLAKQKDH